MLLALAAPAATSPTLLWISALIAISLALIHLHAGKLKLLSYIPRSRWLSLSSGVSVAYVFVHLLPDLSERQETLSETGFLGFIEYHAYLMALLGLAVFYGLERLVKRSRKRNDETQKDHSTEAGVFWLHIASFTLYNGLIGYLLVHRQESDLVSLFLFAIAMGLHFIVNDYGLRQDHKSIYHRVGRWILAGGIILGWAIGAGTAISEAAIAVLFAFLAGGIILNVLKEELPEERESRFWAFALGAAVYAALLLAL